jgi:hypothetical protein
MLGHGLQKDDTGNDRGVGPCRQPRDYDHGET